MNGNESKNRQSPNNFSTNSISVSPMSEPLTDQKESKHPLETKQINDIYEDMKVDSGVYEMQGARRTMEDKHVVLPHPEFNTATGLTDLVHRNFFAVYDGHGGYVAAEYSRQHVHHHLVEDEVFGQKNDTALRSALLKTEANFCNACRKQKLVTSSGTCAIVAYIERDNMVVGNIGDSRCVLSSNNRALPISVDHKPGRKDERERVESLGGRVGRTEDEAFGREEQGCSCFKTLFLGERPQRIFPGGLSVSRTIGDIGMKATQLITAEPEIFVRRLIRQDEFVILACDGVWDVLTDQQACDLVRKNIDDANKAARTLSFEAYKRGSKDNISVVVIVFRWQPTKLKE